MSDLIAIGYPDETTAELAATEARRLARDLIIEPDAIAVIVRDSEGKFHVHTSHNPVGAGATWGMFWGLLFGLLFFIPFFGAGIDAGPAGTARLATWRYTYFISRPCTASA
jgi:uncharacterized membrane protein